MDSSSCDKDHRQVKWEGGDQKYLHVAKTKTTDR